MYPRQLLPMLLLLILALALLTLLDIPITVWSALQLKLNVLANSAVASVSTLLQTFAASIALTTAVLHSALVLTELVSCYWHCYCKCDLTCC